MKKLKPNQIKLNEELIILINKHGVSNEEFEDCVKVMFPKTFKVRSNKFVQIKEFGDINAVNAFIKDKTLRGRGIDKIPYSSGTSSYLVTYYEEDERNG